MIKNSRVSTRTKSRSSQKSRISVNLNAQPVSPRASKSPLGEFCALVNHIVSDCICLQCLWGFDRVTEAPGRLSLKSNFQRIRRGQLEALALQTWPQHFRINLPDCRIRHADNTWPGHSLNLGWFNAARFPRQTKTCPKNPDQATNFPNDQSNEDCSQTETVTTTLQ
mgnify:FL=1